MQLPMATVKSPLVFVPQIFFSLQVFSGSPWPEVLLGVQSFTLLQVKLQLQEVPHLPNHQEAPSLSPAAVMQAKFQGFIIQQILNIFGEVFDYFILQIFKPVS